MKQEKVAGRKVPPVKMIIMKKKTMHLPVLTLQNYLIASRTIKNKLPQSESKQKKRSISQLLHIVECPEPTDNIFLKRAGQRKKILTDHRENVNKSDNLISRRKRSNQFLKSLRLQLEDAIQKLVQVKKKEIPKIRSLRAYIERQSAIRGHLMERAKDSQRIYKTLEGKEVTGNQVKIEPISSCRKLLSYQSLQSSLLRKDSTKRESHNEGYRPRKRERRNNKSELRCTDEKEEHLSGWWQLRERYKSWQGDEDDAPVLLECEYFQG